VRFTTRTLLIAVMVLALLMGGARLGFGLWWAAQLDRKEAAFLQYAAQREKGAAESRERAARGETYDPNRYGGRYKFRSWAEEAAWLAKDAASCREQAAVYARVRPYYRPWW
jgi:hypothetical protein